MNTVSQYGIIPVKIVLKVVLHLLATYTSCANMDSLPIHLPYYFLDSSCIHVGHTVSSYFHKNTSTPAYSCNHLNCHHVAAAWCIKSCRQEITDRCMFVGALMCCFEFVRNCLSGVFTHDTAAQQSQEFAQDGVKNKKHPVTHIATLYKCGEHERRVQNNPQADVP